MVSRAVNATAVPATNMEVAVHRAQAMSTLTAHIEPAQPRMPSTPAAVRSTSHAVTAWPTRSGP